MTHPLDTGRPPSDRCRCNRADIFITATEPNRLLFLVKYSMKLTPISEDPNESCTFTLKLYTLNSEIRCIRLKAMSMEYNSRKKHICDGLDKTTVNAMMVTRYA